MSKNRQNEDEPGLITYMVQCLGKPDFQMQIPADWKVTFASVNPASQMSSRDLHCLRVWEGEKLRAVFCDVRGFRDLSIPLARKIEAEVGSSTWQRDDAGNYEASQKRQLETRFEAETDTPF